VKFRGWDRWLAPQFHESVFRRVGGEAVFAGATLDLTTVRTQVGSAHAASITITAFNVPSDVLNACIMVGISATDAGTGASVNVVTWNGHNLLALANGTHANGNSANLYQWPIVAGDLGDTSDIVCTFDSGDVLACVMCAYIIENVDTTAIDVSDEASNANSATIALPLTTTVPNDLIVDWLTHVYSGAAPDPAATGTNQTEIAGSQVTDSTALIGVGSMIPKASAGVTSVNWGSLDATSSSSVQVAVALKPMIFVPPTQPVTAKLVIGYDFSGIDSTITIAGVGISNITDSSGNANSATQTTDSRRLLHGSATINTRLAADTNADLTKNVNMPASITGWAANGQPPLHILCVFQVKTWTTARQIVSFQNTGAAPRVALRLSTSGGTRIEMRTPTAVPGTTVTLSTETALAINTTYLAELGIDGAGNASLIINEGTAATAAAAASGESLTIRRVGDQTVAFDGLIACCYIFNDALTAGELTSWRTFLKYRWGYV